MLDGDWRWEDVTVMLDRDGETIGFDLPGCFSIRRHYAQLSFSNASIKTGAMLPIDCWDVFKEFLRSGRDECGRGRFRFHDEVAGDGSGERKVVETINTKLVGGTGSRDGNPIISVGPRSYRTRFKVQNLPDETIEAETDPLATPEDVADAQRCRDWVESKLRALGKPNPMIGASRALLPVYVGIRAIAERRDRLAPVLIYGAQGTGKELLMQLVHDISEATGRYVTFNATGIPDNMVESTLFGIVKGAATGVEASPGLFEEAAGGTLVLDCMEEASSGLQDKLLRAVDPTTRKYRPVGGGRDKDTECRVLMTFNQPLPLLIQRQKLRSDLPDRFEFQISLPPLDSRREDIPELVGHFALEYLHEEGLDRLVPQMEELFGIADFITFCESQNWSNREQDLNIRGLRKYVWQRLATRKRRLVDAGTISVPGARIEEMSASAFADLLRETIPNDATSHFRSSNKLGSLQKIIQVFGAASTVQGLVAGFGYDHSEHLMKALGRLKHEGLRNLLIRRFRALPG
jgi:transcriptional regulator with AAA-type ATPase domain